MSGLGARAALFAALLAAGAHATCGGEAAPAPSAAIAPGEVVWRSRADAVCVEPAATVDAAGRTWVAWLAFREVGAEPRLVAGPLDGPLVTVDGDLPRVAAPALAPLSDGGVYLVFEAQPDGAPALFGRELALVPGNVRAGELERVAPARALLPAVAATGPGAVEVVWQALVGPRYELAWRRRGADGAWGEARPLDTEASGDAWRPRAASAGDGRLHVAFDRFDGASFDVRYLELEDGRVARALDVAATPAYEGLPDVALDGQGRAWIAWEEAPQLGETDGLRAERTVRLAAVEDGVLRRADFAPAGRADLPRVAWDGSGLVVTARAPGDPWPPRGAEEWAGFYASWFTRAFVFDARGEPRETTLAATDGDNDATEVLLRSEGGGARVLFAADLRTQRRPVPGAFQEPTEGFWRVGTIDLPPSAGLPRLAASEPDGAGRAEGPRPTVRPDGPGHGGPPWLGDLHRHTHLSRCQGAKDGTRLDAYRYARGPGELDFLAITDHYQHLTPWSWWRSLRDVERFHAPGSLVVFAGIERALRTRAHVNEVYLEAAEVPREIAAFHRDPAQPGPVPAEHALAVPHMMGMDSAPFPWEDFDGELHRLVEVYQGLRGSYEGPGLPYESEDRTADASAVGAGLARGEHFGLIASSDHRASSTAFAGAWSDELTRASVLAALRARRAFAASAPCSANAALGPLGMGERGSSPAGAPLVVRAHSAAGADVATVDVVKNGRPFARRAGEGARELVVLTLRDYRPSETSVRVEGAALAGWRVRQRGETGARVRADDGGGLVATKGVPFVDLVLELERNSGAEAVLVLGRGAAIERVTLDALEPGRSTRDLAALPSVSLWRLGRPLARGTVELAFPDPERAPGDVYYARIAFTDGNLAWTSPIRVDALGE